MGYFNGIYAASLSILDNNLQLDCEKTLKHAENLIENKDTNFLKNDQHS